MLKQPGCGFLQGLGNSRLYRQREVTFRIGPALGSRKTEKGIYEQKSALLLG